MMALPKHLQEHYTPPLKNTIKCSICNQTEGYYNDGTLIRTTPKGVEPKQYVHKSCLKKQTID